MTADLTLIVTDRRQESRDVVSLTLAAPDGAALPAFRAGQHLPLRLDLPARKIATYTISSAPASRHHYRISVKRAVGGLGGAAFLHDHAPIGTALRAAPPRGSFVIADPQKPLLFLTGGIGITPALSMLTAQLAQGAPARPVIFLHACNSPAETSFADELAALAQESPMVKIVLFHAQGGAGTAWQAGCLGTEEGLITRAMLQKHVPLDDYDSYLCGPPAFMTAMRGLLRDLGRPDGSIRQESFGGDGLMPAQVAKPIRATAQSAASQVTFAASGSSALWDGAESLLDFAEAQGLTPEFSCRAGVCGNCACTLVTGAVDYVTEPLDAPPAGQVLLCCAKPRGDITLAL